MSDTKETVMKIGEIERRISDGESLLRGIERANSVGWFLLVVGLLMVFFLGELIFIIIGSVIVIIGIIRLISVSKNRREIENGLREYRGRKAELQSSLITKD